MNRVCFVSLCSHYLCCFGLLEFPAIKGFEAQLSQEHRQTHTHTDTHTYTHITDTHTHTQTHTHTHRQTMQSLSVKYGTTVHSLLAYTKTATNNTLWCLIAALSSYFYRQNKPLTPINNSKLKQWALNHITGAPMALCATLLYNYVWHI